MAADSTTEILVLELRLLREEVRLHREEIRQQRETQILILQQLQQLCVRTTTVAATSTIPKISSSAPILSETRRKRTDFSPRNHQQSFTVMNKSAAVVSTSINTPHTPSSSSSSSSSPRSIVVGIHWCEQSKDVTKEWNYSLSSSLQTELCNINNNNNTFDNQNHWKVIDLPFTSQREVDCSGLFDIILCVTFTAGTRLNEKAIDTINRVATQYSSTKKKPTIFMFVSLRYGSNSESLNITSIIESWQPKFTSTGILSGDSEFKRLAQSIISKTKTNSTNTPRTTTTTTTTSSQSKRKERDLVSPHSSSSNSFQHQHH